jgi:hypothetical protein
LVKLLEKYKEEEDKTVYNHLTILTFACMYNFGGYPTVYKPLLDVIKVRNHTIFVFNFKTLNLI